MRPPCLTQESRKCEDTIYFCFGFHLECSAERKTMLFYLLNTRDSNVFLKSSLVTFLNGKTKLDNQNLLSEYWNIYESDY